jgi:uncharacterized membrane protein
VNWVHSGMILLSIAGLGVSAYLTWAYTTPGASLACGGSYGCDTVRNSSYSHLMGIPLPVIGLVTYFVLLVLLVGQSQSTIGYQGWTPYVALATFGIALAGVLYSAYLTYLELYVIYAICRWCVASAVIIVAVFLLSMVNLRSSNQTLRN